MSVVSEALSRSGLAEQLTTPLTLEQEERIITLIELRAAWSQTHNLSGPKALALVGTDIADAVAVWLCYSGVALLDVGSGSGVPGLMVACLAPEHPVYLVEPIAKRCAFMRTAAHRLELSQVHIHRGRWPSETLDQLGDVTPISRAVVSPEAWPLLADRPHISSVMQMLALQRPMWPLEQYHLVQEVSYQDPDGGDRLVRRWKRILDT